MVSNLRSAQQAIKAELDHAKKGMAFYMSRVQALQGALEKLESVDGAGIPASETANAQADGNAAKATRIKRTPVSRPAVRPNGMSGSTVLPKTGGDFWRNLVTAEKQSAVDVANAAARSLGLDPKTNRKQVLVLKQRATPALNGLVTSQKIKDSGNGRERRFFKE
jgi:hypothetical protein